MSVAFEQEVEGRLLGRPHLIPVFDHPCKIPQRLRELNRAYYVVLNVARVIEKIDGLHYKDWTPIPPGVTPRYNGWYEVRKLTAPAWMNAALNIPFGALDERTLRYAWENDSEVHGSSLIDRLEEDNRRTQQRHERDGRNMLESITADMSWGRTYYGPGGPGKSGDLKRRTPAKRLYVPV